MDGLSPIWESNSAGTYSTPLKVELLRPPSHLGAAYFKLFGIDSNMGAFVNTGDVGRGTQTEAFRSEKSGF